MPVVHHHAAGTPCWIDLMTTDVTAAAPFYRALFGWDLMDSGEDFGHYHMASVGGHMAAGLGNIPPGANFPPSWTVYLASEDIEADLAKARALGGQVMQPAMAVGDQGHMAVIADPTGAVFGFWQAGAHKGAGIIDEPGGLCWSEVATRDMGAAAAFYAGLTGLTPTPMPGMEGYRTLNGGADGASEPKFGVLQMDAQWGDMHPHWMPYIAVAEMEAALAIVEREGGKVAVPPFDTPYGRMSVIADPQGAHFTVMQLRPRSA